jgi:two-component sensor histidine kinase
VKSGLERLSALALRPVNGGSWAAGLAIFAIAAVLRVAADFHGGGVPFITFFPAVMLITLICGWPRAVAGLLLAVVAEWYYRLKPLDSLIDAAGLASLLLFLGGGAITIAVITGLRELTRQNAQQRRDLATLLGQQEMLVRQQETMFREMQHRVGNNMAFIASMLSASKRQLRRGVAPEALLDQAVARIASMGEMHRHLHDIATYESGLEAVLHTVLADLFARMPVRVDVEIEHRDISMDQMTAIVLLTVEAATNAIKHVYSSGRGKRFHVRLGKMPGDMLRLSVHDDGPGLPAQDDAEGTPRGLGMRIMQGLALQLGGKLHVSSGNGTTVEVTFPRQPTLGAARPKPTAKTEASGES